ncbi:MAG: hypothetical protein JJU18_10345 [Oceanicaulis sp.]|nr:hypothetical protein [Oceanicaulis sp.]
MAAHGYMDVLEEIVAIAERMAGPAPSWPDKVLSKTSNPIKPIEGFPKERPLPNRNKRKKLTRREGASLVYALRAQGLSADYYVAFDREFILGDRVRRVIIENGVLGDWLRLGMVAHDPDGHEDRFILTGLGFRELSDHFPGDVLS